MHRAQGPEETRAKPRYAARLWVLLGVTVAVAVVSFGVGYYPLSPREVFEAAAAGLGFPAQATPQAMTIFWKVRLPRIIAALVIGASLSVSGAVYQGMFHNPLVSPDILGVSAGAGLGAAIAIFCGLPYWATQGFAFAGGLLAVLISYTISQKSVHARTLSLVLTGTMVGTLCNSSVTLLKYLSDPNDVLQQLTFWLMGSLVKVDMQGILRSLPPMLIGLLIIFAMRWQVNLLSLDDEESRSLGVHPGRLRLLMIIASTLLSASAVCLGGLIGWVGLMVPHMARALFGADHRRLVPASLLFGGAYLLVMDNLARALFTMELPIGVVTSFMGAPFFVALILRRKEG